MNMPLYRVVMVGLFAFFVAQSVFAQSKTYPDGHGGEVTFPQGEVSFADEVVHYDTGTEKPVEAARDTSQALGIPDYDKSNGGGYATLGCGGELILKFTDNRLIDIAGPDFYVFEIGPDVEPTALAISRHGENWVRVGRIEGGKAEVDIAPYVDHEQNFRYVKLVDLRRNCGGDTPGADIDAVGAIGSMQRIALDSSVLFDTGKYQLKPAAAAAIDDAVAGIDPERLQSVVVAGYTDAVGSEQSNQVLSKNRAQSVADFLIQQADFPESKIHIEAHGESDPIASNETAAGAAKNRRVELGIRIVAEKSDDKSDAESEIEILGIWQSDKGRLTVLRKVGGAVHGDYTSDGGRIEGAFTSDSVFEGYWIENDSRRTCDAEKDGSKHWGRLRIEFEDGDRDAFDAKWAYCDDQDWHGDWPHAQRIL